MNACAFVSEAVCFGSRVFRCGYYMCVDMAESILFQQQQQHGRPKQQTVNINKERIRCKSAGLNISRFGWWKTTHHNFGRKGLLFWFCQTRQQHKWKKLSRQTPGEAWVSKRQRNRAEERERNNCIFDIQNTRRKKFNKKVKLY